MLKLDCHVCAGLCQSEAEPLPLAVSLHLTASQEVFDEHHVWRKSWCQHVGACSLSGRDLTQLQPSRIPAAEGAQLVSLNQAWS